MTAHFFIGRQAEFEKLKTAYLRPSASFTDEPSFLPKAQRKFTSTSCTPPTNKA